MHPLQRHDRAGLLDTEAPAVVRWERGKGYPWPPFGQPLMHLEGASSLGKGLESWDWWAPTRDAKVAARHREIIAEMGEWEAQQYVKAKIDEEAERGRERGSEFHHWSALVDAKRTKQDAPLGMEGWEAAWDEFKGKYGPSWLGIERTVCAPMFNIAGTVDRIARFKRPPTIKGLPLSPESVVVVDIKTGSQPAEKIQPSLGYLLQIVGLAAANQVAIEEEQQVVAIPPMDAGVIVRLTPEGKAHCTWVDTRDPLLLELAHHKAHAARMARHINASHVGTVHVLGGV